MARWVAARVWPRGCVGPPRNGPSACDIWDGARGRVWWVPRVPPWSQKGGYPRGRREEPERAFDQEKPRRRAGGLSAGARSPFDSTAAPWPRRAALRLAVGKGV